MTDQTLTDAEIDDLDTFALHVMAPEGRYSVRAFARAVLAEAARRAPPVVAEPAAPSTEDRRFAESLLAMIGRISTALGISEEEQSCANGDEEILAEIEELRSRASASDQPIARLVTEGSGAPVEIAQVYRPLSVGSYDVYLAPTARQAASGEADARDANREAMAAVSDALQSAQLREHALRAELDALRRPVASHEPAVREPQAGLSSADEPQGRPVDEAGEREAFETWVTESGAINAAHSQPPLKRDHDTGGYWFLATDAAWLSWLARSQLARLAMTEAERRAAALDYPCLVRYDDFAAGIDAAERHHGIEPPSSGTGEER